MMTTARYNRALDARLVKHLRTGGDLGFLLHGVPLPPGEPYAVDVQLRESNKIMYYRGTTRLLVVTLYTHGEKTPTFTVTADKFYSQDESCADTFRELADHGKRSPVEAEESFRRYLEAAGRVAPEQHYDNKAEGYWQNRICHRFGRCFRSDDAWLVLDRECVIGFENQTEKDNALNPIIHRYKDVCQKLQEYGDDKWRLTHQTKGLGNELDMLAVGRDGQLLAIELKYRTNASGIYWGPVQAGVYSDSFSLLLDTLGPRVIDLVKQKVSLGLLPKHALNRLPADGFKQVRPILAIAEPNPRSACWPKLAEVMRHAGGVEVVTLDGKDTDQELTPGIQSTHIALNAMDMQMSDDRIDANLVSQDGIRHILSFLPALAVKGAKHGEGPSVESIDDSTFTILPANLSDTAMDFVQACYDENFVQSFDWNEWGNQHQAELNTVTFIDHADITSIIKLLTTHIRADRFCDGHLLSVLNDGTIARILARLEKMKG